MALGPRDTRQLVQLTGIDDVQLAKLALQDGTTYAQVVAMMNGALGALNAELRGDPKWAAIASFTDSVTVEYRQTGSNTMVEHTEYTRGDPRRADLEGHMLPLREWDYRLQWTWDFLRKARMSQIEADVADSAIAVRNTMRVQILTRLLKRGDDSGVRFGLGSTGLSPGFATAAASTGVDFTPPANEGTTFTSDHEHYVATAGGAFTLATFQDAYDELREHGHEPPFEAWIGTADRTTVEDLTGFVPPAESLIRTGVLQDVALVDAMQYIGVLENFRIREVRGLPQYYGIFFKSYGPNSQRNPLRIRLPEGQGSPLVTAFPDPNGGSYQNPLQDLMLFTEFGVGVGDRTAATIRYVNNATWADGTPT